jgi:hypothetical protein
MYQILVHFRGVLVRFPPWGFAVSPVPPSAVALADLLRVAAAVPPGAPASSPPALAVVTASRVFAASLLARAVGSPFLPVVAALVAPVSPSASPSLSPAVVVARGRLLVAAASGAPGVQVRHAALAFVSVCLVEAAPARGPLFAAAAAALAPASPALS